LERIARDSEKDHWTVMEVLTAYVRENANTYREKSANPKWKEQVTIPTTDIRAILAVIGRRERTYNKGESQRLELWEAKLDKTDLTGANLSHADLSFAFLRAANLTHANLAGADLTEAELGHAILTGATLAGADLTTTSLTQQQVESAFGDGTTKLPQGIHMPESWKSG
jgi:uncharacterized protein YjbI with pentapeptide repeats